MTQQRTENLTYSRSTNEQFLSRGGRRSQARRIAISAARHRQWITTWDWLVYSFTLRETKRARRWMENR